MILVEYKRCIPTHPHPPTHTILYIYTQIAGKYIHIYYFLVYYYMIDKQIYTPEQCPDIFNFLDTLEVEYHKPYKRFNQIVKVPRGQASYTLDETIH